MTKLDIATTAALIVVSVVAIFVRRARHLAGEERARLDRLIQPPRRVFEGEDQALREAATERREKGERLAREKARVDSGGATRPKIERIRA